MGWSVPPCPRCFSKPVKDYAWMAGVYDHSSKSQVHTTLGRVTMCVTANAGALRLRGGKNKVTYCKLKHQPVIWVPPMFPDRPGSSEPGPGVRGYPFESLARTPATA